MGVATYDRGRGGWEEDSDEDDKTKKKPIADIDRDVQFPVDEIGEDDSDRPPADPEVDIEDEGGGLDIVPAIPNNGENTDEDDEAVIRGNIIREDQEKQN